MMLFISVLASKKRTKLAPQASTHHVNIEDTELPIHIDPCVDIDLGSECTARTFHPRSPVEIGLSQFPQILVDDNDQHNGKYAYRVECIFTIV